MLYCVFWIVPVKDNYNKLYDFNSNFMALLCWQDEILEKTA